MSITLCGSGTQVTVPEKGCNDCGTVADNLKEFETKVEEEYYDKVEVNDLLSAIKTATIQVVDELPNPGETNIIYLVPKTAAETASEDETSDIYNEYVYVNGKYEYIGSTEVPQYWTVTNVGIHPTVEYSSYKLAINRAQINEFWIDDSIRYGVDGDSLDIGDGYIEVVHADSDETLYKSVTKTWIRNGVLVQSIDKGQASSAKFGILANETVQPTATSEAIVHSFYENNALLRSKTASNIDVLKLLGYTAEEGQFLRYTGTEGNQFAWTTFNIPKINREGGWLSQVLWNKTTLNTKELYTNSFQISGVLSEAYSVICQPSVASTDTFTHSAGEYYKNGVGFLSATDNLDNSITVSFYAETVPTDNIYVDVTVFGYGDDVMTTNVSDDELEFLGELKPVAGGTTEGTIETSDADGSSDSESAEGITESTTDDTATTSDTSEEREV